MSKISSKSFPIGAVEAKARHHERAGSESPIPTVRGWTKNTPTLGCRLDQPSLLGNSRATHEASVKAGYADDDMFQRFLCPEQADLRVDLNYPDLPNPRTEKMLMIEVLVSTGTAAAGRHV
jgi:hypothetical protein